MYSLGPPLRKPDRRGLADNLATCWQLAGNLCWQPGNPGAGAQHRISTRVRARPMSRRFCFRGQQLGAKSCQKRRLSARWLRPVRRSACGLARAPAHGACGHTVWPASASAAASWSTRDLRSRCFCCSSALGSAPAPAWKVMNVRARGVHGQCAIEGRSRFDCSVVAGAWGHVVRKRADPRWASSNHAGRRGRFSWPCWTACHALVCPLQRTYSEVTSSIYNSVYSARYGSKYGR